MAWSDSNSHGPVEPDLMFSTMRSELSELAITGKSKIAKGTISEFCRPIGNLSYAIRHSASSIADTNRIWDNM